MGDLIFLIIILGGILLSLIEKLGKGKKDKDAPSLDERLEAAIRRSKEMAEGRRERSRPPAAPVPTERRPPPPTRLDAPPTARMPESPSRAPAPTRREIPPTRIPEPPRPFPTEPPAARPSPAALEPAPIFVQTTMQKLQTTKSYEAAARPVRAASPTGAFQETDLQPLSSRRKRSFSRRQLRDLIVFGEALQRPRLLREHPIYTRISRI
jgi:hypothetical protein